MFSRQTIGHIKKFLIYHLHKSPFSKQLYIIEVIGLYKQIHFFLLQLCFDNCLPRLIFSHFQDEEQDSS